MAIAIAFGVFASNHFCPTCLNVSDDPSVDLRGPVAHGPVYQSLDFEGVFRLAELPKLKRWAANWVILVLGLSGPRTFIPPVLKSLDWRCRQRSLPISLHQAILDFDATLGFPGEGPGKVRFVWIWIVWCFSIGAPRGLWTLVAGAPSNGLAPGCRALDLGSMRAGGATFLQMLLEDAELTRRRGRWLSARTMEIYLQESSATLFFPQQPAATKERIMQAAQTFTNMLQKVKLFRQNHIPTAAWYLLVSAETDAKQMGKNGSLGGDMDGKMDDNIHTNPEYQDGQKAADRRQGKEAEHLAVGVTAIDLPLHSQASPGPPTREAWRRYGRKNG